MLLNCIGSHHYNLLCSLISPKSTNDLKYGDIISVLEKHLCPKSNVIIEQHRFLSRFQNKNISDYVAALRKFISTCDFTCECKNSVPHLFLRAQFIRGLKDDNIREQLLLICDLTFNEAADQSLAYECKNCAEVKHNPTVISNHHWEEPSANFERVHIDYTGPFFGFNFLILIDAISKWPEIRMQRNPPTSESTMCMLRDIFSVHGLPQVLVSDNASIFKSTEFKEYCVENGILQKFIAPEHPATNGLAERNVQTIKTKLKSMSGEHSSIPDKLREILFRFRATPLQSGRTPAELYLGL